MASSFRISAALWDRIHHFASFPQTGVSLQQMVLFGQNPSQGTLFKASQFLVEELPIRLAHRVKELDELPHNLPDMPSIKKVKNWYCQSFEELINFPKFYLSPELKRALYPANGGPPGHTFKLPESVPNPSLLASGDGSGESLHGFPYQTSQQNGSSSSNGGAKLRIPIERRYYAAVDSSPTWPPELHDYNARFTRLLENIKRRHDPTVTTVAQGVLEWKRLQPVARSHIGLDVQAWLDRFYMSRIGIRFLIGQHVALNTLEPHPDYVGIICTRANVRDIVHEAIENARFVCEEHYGMFRGPPVQLICAPELNFPYVPGHLSHICFELLKNSLRAVVERFGASDADKLPPIKVIVSEGKEDITIKISDEGGGIPRSAIALIWTYMYTTMMSQSLVDDFRDTDFKAPMAGFGYGLPLSRLVRKKSTVSLSRSLSSSSATTSLKLSPISNSNSKDNGLTPDVYRSFQYARYFGGDLKLISMEGYGTDVYIHLNRLSSSREPLQ